MDHNLCDSQLFDLISVDKLEVFQDVFDLATIKLYELHQIGYKS